MKISLVGSLLALTPVATAQAQESTPDSPDIKASNTDVADAELPDTTTGDDFRVDSSGDGTIGAEVNPPGTAGVRGPTTVTVNTGRARCTHRPATYGEYPNVVAEDAGRVPSPDSQVSRDVNGQAEVGWVRVCPGPGATTDDFYWVPAAIDPVDLVPDALARVRAQLAAPSPAINPDATAGGIVNLGMWLAIDDPGTTTARATLGGVWAEVTADVSGLEIDLGNGDTVTCDALGTPIPDAALDELDQGPCGYTYRRSSPDDQPYQLAITAVHEIAWTTSTGAGGTLADIRRTVTLGYDVDEIQTIGVSN